MHALARRLARPALTLETALLAVSVVALWGDPRWARSYVVFVGLSAAALVLAALVLPARRR